MPDLLDIRILSSISSLISLMLCGCMVYIFRTRKTYNGFLQWTLASIVYSVALALMGLRHVIPDVFSIILANSLIILGVVFIVHGLQQFTKSPKRTVQLIAVILITTGLLCYFTYQTPSVSARIILISTIIGLLYGYCAFIIHQNVPLLLRAKNLFLVTLFGFQALWSLARVMEVLFFEGRIRDYMQASAFHGLNIIVFFSCNILLIIGLIVLNFQKLEFDLSTTSADVKTLQGILPICLSCKKIRNDKGIWDQIENYIRQHSDAEFSHGLCPDCVQKLYPDLLE